MRRSILTTFALCLAVLLAFVVASAVAKEKKAKQGQLNGTVHMINKDTSTITVMKNNAQRQVVYNNDTKWMYGTQGSAKPSSLDQLKENWYVNCKGTFDGVKLVASACRFRESK
jgi:ABC-type antimicrobial peptide transport system permease subunit